MCNICILANIIPVLWSFCYANSGLDSVAASRKHKGSMSPRKCPTCAPALLAANRANTQKSTGPGTAEDKTRVALNAVRHGLPASQSLFSHLAQSHCTRERVQRNLPRPVCRFSADETRIDVMKRIELHLWAMKHEALRWAASPKEREAGFAQTGGMCPAPEQLLSVPVSVWVDWGRGRGGHWWHAGPAWKERRTRLHVAVTVTAPMRHTLLGCFRAGASRKGVLRV